METPQTRQQSDQEPQRTPCPRCSYYVELGKPEIDEDLKRDYVRSLYGARPFTWTFDVQGVKYTFTSLSRREERDKERVRMLIPKRAVHNQLIEDAANALEQYDPEAAKKLLDKKESFDVDNIDSSVALIDAYYSLRQLDEHRFGPPETGALDTIERMLESIDSRFGEMSSEAVAMIVHLSDLFKMMIQAAKESCLDANFWKGAGLVQPSEPSQKA